MKTRSIPKSMNFGGEVRLYISKETDNIQDGNWLGMRLKQPLFSQAEV